MDSVEIRDIQSSSYFAKLLYLVCLGVYIGVEVANIKDKHPDSPLAITSLIGTLSDFE